MLIHIYILCFPGEFILFFWRKKKIVLKQAITKQLFHPFSFEGAVIREKQQQ